jgi:hypothetical protein
MGYIFTHRQNKLLSNKSNGIDCSRIFFGKCHNSIFSILKATIVAATFLHEYNVIAVNSNEFKKLKEQYYDEYISKILSHESLHMVLYHFIGHNKECSGIDDLLKKKGRYDTLKLELSGL